MIIQTCPFSAKNDVRYYTIRNHFEVLRLLHWLHSDSNHLAASVTKFVCKVICLISRFTNYHFCLLEFLDIGTLAIIQVTNSTCILSSRYSLNFIEYLKLPEFVEYVQQFENSDHRQVKNIRTVSKQTVGLQIRCNCLQT